MCVNYDHYHSPIHISNIIFLIVFFLFSLSSIFHKSQIFLASFDLLLILSDFFFMNYLGRANHCPLSTHTHISTSITTQQTNIKKKWIFGCMRDCVCIVCVRVCMCMCICVCMWMREKIICLLFGHNSQSATLSDRLWNYFLFCVKLNNYI